MSQSDPKPLAELHEKDAPPHIQAIYADIKRLGGVPMVALIYRHLATLPGVIESAWHQIGPLCRAGLLQEAAWRVSAGVRLHPPRRYDALALSDLGISPEATANATAVLDAYNRANPLNMMGVSALLIRLADPNPAGAPVDAAPFAPPEPIGPLPPMTAPTDMPPTIIAAIAAISPRAAAGTTRAVPSLYRHLCDMPEALALYGRIIGPMLADGAIDTEAARLRSQWTEEAKRLARHMAPLPATSEWAAAETALRRFTGLIPEMTVIGTILRRAMPA